MGMTSAGLHDGSELPLTIRGQSPWWLLPVNPEPIEGTAAEEMRRWGADPALGAKLIEGLEDLVTVVAFDYEGHLLVSPKPDTLTADNIAADSWQSPTQSGPTLSVTTATPGSRRRACS